MGREPNMPAAWPYRAEQGGRKSVELAYYIGLFDAKATRIRTKLRRLKRRLIRTLKTYPPQ
jgi:hypothetical protein